MSVPLINAPSLMCHTPDGDMKGDGSDHEGSLTPTNESPPTLDILDEPTTPKDDSEVCTMWE